MPRKTTKQATHQPDGGAFRAMWDDHSRCAPAASTWGHPTDVVDLALAKFPPCAKMELFILPDYFLFAA